MVLKNGAVMSKSKGNVVDPDDMTARFGADALRLYVMFVAPPEKEVEWIDTGLEGAAKFLGRIWRICDHLTPAVRNAASPAAMTLDADERALRRRTHVTIRRVTLDIDPRMHRTPPFRADGNGERAQRVRGEARRPPVGNDDEPPAVVERPGGRAFREARGLFRWCRRSRRTFPRSLGAPGHAGGIVPPGGRNGTRRLHATSVEIPAGTARFGACDRVR
jgi:hypothetical protein